MQAERNVQRRARPLQQPWHISLGLGLHQGCPLSFLDQQPKATRSQCFSSRGLFLLQPEMNLRMYDVGSILLEHKQYSGTNRQPLRTHRDVRPMSR